MRVRLILHDKVRYLHVGTVGSKKGFLLLDDASKDQACRYHMVPMAGYLYLYLLLQGTLGM